MRHRIGMAAQTGLGNPDPAVLGNNWPTDRRYNSLVRRCLIDAVDKFFTREYELFDQKEIEAWCDFSVHEDRIMIGQEPAYQYEHLKVVCINTDKENSYITQGVAWGGYGSNVASTTRFYKDYKRNSKFTKFIDRWHPILFG